MRDILVSTLLLASIGSPFAASLALVKFSSLEYRVMGGVADGMQNIELDMSRPSVVATGENFMVVANYAQTRLFANDGTRLHNKQIGRGKTNWVRFGKNFAVVKFRDGYFCYAVNSAGELVGAKISPSSYASPNRLVFLDSMVVHDWSSGGAFATYLEEGQLKSSMIHRLKLKEIWYRQSAKTAQDKVEEQTSLKMQSHDKLHQAELGTVLFPAHKNDK